MKNEEKERGSESCVLSLVIWFSSQPGSLAESENDRAEEERKRTRERENGNVRETEREGFLSPLSGLSPIATVA